MRSLLENNDIRSPRILSGLQYGTAVLAITSNQVLVGGMPVVLGFDPGNTDRTITMEAVTEGVIHEITNYSTGTGSLLLKNPSAAALGSVPPGGRARCMVVNGVWAAWVSLAGNAVQTSAAKSTISLYTTLAGLVNTNKLAVAVPFPFTLNSVGFRVRTPVTTAAKAATLTGQVNDVSVTGGVISLTSANATPTNTLVAGTAITAGGTGTAGQTVGVLVSSVTAFIEGDGYVEFNLTNTGLAA